MKKRLLTILGAILVTSLSAQVTHTKVGQTKYSLQSNGATYNRIVKNADGTISVAWTYSSADGTDWLDRGTGYNYFDGASWINPVITASRAETARTGFPSIVTTNSGAEVITAHNSIGAIRVSRRATKGVGPWTETLINTDMLWNRTVVGGANHETIHMIAHDASLSEGQLLYLKSTNAGITWTSPGEIVGFTAAEFPGQFRGDEYAIAAKGDTVAVIYGGQQTGVYMAKSIDNGVTWAKTAIDPFPIPNYVATNDISDVDGDGIADTLTVNEGAVNVTIDKLGKVHVFWGKMRIFDDEPAAQPSYFPATDGIMHWSEGMTSPHQIASLVDDDGNGSFNFSQWYVPDWGFGMYGASLTSYPSAAVDDNNFIYVAYSGLVEANQKLVDDDYDSNTPDVLLYTGPGVSGKLFRHVYVTYSGDGGSTWSKPFDTNVNNPEYPTKTEAVFPSLANIIDNNLHILYQRDTIPGYGVTSTDDPNNADMFHDLVYLKVPKSALSCNSMVISVSTVKDTCMNSVGVLNLTNVAGAVSPYTYEWGSVVGTASTFLSTGVSNISASGMLAGVYKVAVIDDRGCKDTLQFTLQNRITPIAVSLTQVTQPADCTTLDGAISSSVVGGGLPLSYSWSNSSSTNSSITGVGIGAHILTVTDRNTCKGVGSIILLPVTNTATFTTTISTTITECFGGSEGKAEISVLPAGAYSYTWTPSGQTGTLATGFSAGTYDVYISEGSCGKLATFTISQPTSLVTATLTSTNVICNGETNGTVTATASGGTAPYTFSWNAAAGNSIVFDNTSSTITGLAKGTGYGVSVTDKYNCTVVTPSNVLINTPAVLAIAYGTIVAPSGVVGNNNGTINVTVGGGNPPYNLSWTSINPTATGTGPQGVLETTTPTAVTGIAVSSLTPYASTYTITAVDSKGCTVTGPKQKVTGIEDNTEIVKDLSVYPNPTSESVLIDFTVSTPSNVSVKLISLNGQLVYSNELGQFAGKFSHKVDMSTEAKGVYFLQITTDKDVINKKIIKN